MQRALHRVIDHNIIPAYEPLNRVLDHNVIPAYEPESEDEIPDQVRDDLRSVQDTFKE